MKPLHEELKYIRTKKGVSLEEISETTKIRIDFLERIDEGDYTVVPEPFLRAFFKEYAEYLKIDSDLVLKRLDNKLKTILSPEEIEEIEKKQKESDGNQAEIPSKEGTDKENDITPSDDSDGNEVISEDSENAEKAAEETDDKDEVQTSLFENESSEKELKKRRRKYRKKKN